MAKPANSNSSQLSLELSTEHIEKPSINHIKSSSSVANFVDGQTREIRRQAIERVVSGGIFDVKKPTFD